jgi:hypothetical protein
MDSMDASRMTRRMAASLSPKCSIIWFVRPTLWFWSCRSKCWSRWGRSRRRSIGFWRRRARRCRSVISRPTWPTREAFRKSSFSSSSRGPSDDLSSSSDTELLWTNC